MNPFEEETFDDFDDEFKNDSLLLDTKKIIISCQDVKGKKKMTFVENWDLEKDELKEHLKILKKRLGCNGSVKNTDEGIIFQLQGDKKDIIRQYLIDNNINEENIYVKG